VFASEPVRLAPTGPCEPSEPSRIACGGCGRACELDQVIPLAGHPVCGSCKPRRLQCLREGLTNGGIRVGTGIQVEGSVLVVHTGAVSPARCVHCNQPSSWNIQRHYTWHPPLIFLSLLLTPLALIPIAFLFSRRAVFDLHLCDLHRRHRQLRLGIAWLWGLGGLALFVGVPFLASIGLLHLFAAACLQLSAFISALMAPLYGQRIQGVLLVQRIEPDGTLRLRGAHPDYLASLSQPVTPDE
jgi:hypothetical protein